MIRKKPLKKSLSLFLTTALIFSSLATLFVLPPAISIGALRTASTGCTSQIAETSLIIDSSGSMYGTDPTNLRKSAAKYFIDLAQINDKISIVDFDEDVVTLATPTTISGTTERTSLKAAVDQIDSSGLTAIGSGLQRGYDELNKSTTPTRKVGVLLTDGDETAGSWNNQHLLFKAKGWPVYTIALSSSADKTLMQQIANETGGSFYEAPDNSTLQQIYSQISQTTGCGSTLFNKTVKMASGQSTTNNVTIVGTSQGSFSSSWPGSDVTLKITKPNGKTVSSTDTSIYYVKASTYEIYRINNPARGVWRIKATASNMAAGGENVNLSVSSPDSAASLTIGAKPKSISAGQTTVVKGKLKDSNGSGIASKKVNIKAGNRTVGKVRTDKKGNYKLRVKPGKTTNYQAIFGGDGTYIGVRSKKLKVKVRR